MNIHLQFDSNQFSFDVQPTKTVDYITDLACRIFDLKKEIVRRSRKEALKTSLIFRISNIPFTNKDFKNFLITLEQKGIKQW